VPGTFNHKTNPPKPVQLANLPLVIYDFAQDLALLPTVAPQVSVGQGTAAPTHTLFAEGVDPSRFKKHAAGFPPPDDALQAGIDKHEGTLLKAEPILEHCGFMKHALETEGADYANPLWNLSVLCSAFMENGNAIAHEISKATPPIPMPKPRSTSSVKPQTKNVGSAFRVAKLFRATAAATAVLAHTGVKFHHR